ncbi:hypothetical protein BT96DRAFT_449382 [Gymnopus androsaceus JB14]|uniref:Uncharacterized protein n=1 Tax=Gymnopus androsaceus JB14 TaxID=1447944 RepID=A0A6A4GQH6_9AGAR|nr:hypothetical protein BT96DRAFT_449382 [Gymnopus androsaceus JB14]
MSSDKVGISDVNFVADLVRQQGEELLRLRKELETTQKVNAASIDALRAAERHIEDLQQNCSQWRLRFLNIRLELDALQTENDSMASQLEATRADLRTGLDFANLSESFVEPQQPIEERAPSSSTSIAAAEESDLDGYTSISFRDIASSSTSSVIGRPDVTDCPIPNRAASDDWLEVGACGLDYAASTVSESNRDEEKVSHAGTEILISDEEVRLERPRVLDADKNETPKSDISEAATVDLDEQNDDVSVNPFTEQFMSESLDGIPRHVNHLARSLSVEYLKPVCSRLTNTTNKVVDALCLRVSIAIMVTLISPTSRS